MAEEALYLVKTQEFTLLGAAERVRRLASLCPAPSITTVEEVCVMDEKTTKKFSSWVKQPKKKGGVPSKAIVAKAGAFGEKVAKVTFSEFQKARKALQSFLFSLLSKVRKGLSVEGYKEVSGHLAHIQVEEWLGGWRVYASTPIIGMTGGCYAVSKMEVSK